MKKIISIALILCMVVSLSTFNVFADNDPVAELYKANGNSISYTVLEDALSAAQSGDTVYLLTDTTLYADATVKSGCKLVVPYSETDEGVTDGEANVKNAAPVSGTAYVTLTVDSDATLTINGIVIVSGNQQATQPKTGCLTGDFGKINLLSYTPLNRQ